MTTPAEEREALSGVVERVVFHNPENGFAVLRVRVRGSFQPATVVGRKSGPGQRSRLLQPPARCRPLVPHSRSDAVAKAVRVSAATVGIEHRPIQTGVEGLADVRKPGAAVWTEHRPIQFGRVAFPTLRPPRLWFCRGPAPWTKRGKRTTAVPLAGSVRQPDRVSSDIIKG